MEHSWLGRDGNKLMRPPDPIIISIGRTIMNLGKYIVYKISLLLIQGDDYLSDKMPIWFSNTRYYREKRIVDNALKSVYRVKVSEQNIRDWKGTDHTPLDLGFDPNDLGFIDRDRDRRRFSNKPQRFSDGEVEGDNFPDVVMNGNWKQVHR